MGILDIPGFSQAQANAKFSALKAGQPGRKAVFLGDSITNRSTAAAARGFVDQIPKLLGSSAISPRSLVKGTPGDRSDQMLARYAADVRANGAELVFLLAGTNDAEQGVTLATFSANIKAIVAEAKKDGIPIIIGTVPPRPSSVSAGTRLLISQYNTWLNLWAPGVGVPIAPVNAYLSTPSFSEDMLAGYDSGDAIHPESQGHHRIAEAFVAAYNAAGLNSPLHMVKAPSAFNLIANPLFTSNFSGGWYEQPGGTGTGASYSVAADSTGKLTYGQWGVADIDCTGTAGQRYRVYPITTGFAVGDKLLVTGRFDYEDVTGTFRTGAISGAAANDFSLRVMDQGFTLSSTLVSQSVGAPGPVATIFTVPAGMTTIYLAVLMRLGVGLRTKFKIGEVGVFNVTNLPDIANLV